MGIYKIKFNSYDYDQYDGFIVKAENEEEVIKILKEEIDFCVDWKSGYKINKIEDDNKSEILLGSFNAS